MRGQSVTEARETPAYIHATVPLNSLAREVAASSRRCTVLDVLMKETVIYS
jgi:hypothetical protein